MRSEVFARLFSVIPAVIAITACAQAESDPPTDYSVESHWLRLPGQTKEVDVFYLYPTAWSRKEGEPVICDVDHPMMLSGAESAYKRQAAAFETVANVFAPFYRQADATYTLSLPPEQRDELLKRAAVADAEAAFDYYIKHYNNGRPFMLAGHSQGSNTLLFLLSGYLKDHPDVYKRMIAAYVIGYSVTNDFLQANPHLAFAQGPDDTGVIISYNTQSPGVADGANPVVLPGALAINPVTWTRGETPATTAEGLGSFMPDQNGEFVKVPQYADARVDTARGAVICSTADDSKLLLGFGPGVYHSYDYPFYYFNIRANAENRVRRYLDAQQASGM